MAKSPDAFRTISEVAEWLGIQAHVLRFWESKFTQVRPIKRAGGRRYYRPNDMLLLGGIKQLLHEDGLTIKGVQKILREEGMSHVANLSMPLDELTQSQLEDPPEAAFVEVPEEVAEEKGVVLSFDSVPAKATPEEDNTPAVAETAPQVAPVAETAAPESETPKTVDDTPEVAAPQSETAEPSEPPVSATPETAAPTEPIKPPPTEEAAALPAFLRRPMADAPAATDNAPPTEPVPEPPKPRIIDMPALTPEHEIAAAPSTLSAVARTRQLSTAQAKQIAPLLDKLTILRDSMAAHRKGATNTEPTSGPNA